jgi:peptidoglycan/xylan/chitin deacetylase (PgdA/CDA1 family)
MNLNQVWSRIQGRCLRAVGELLFRRPLRMHNTVPYISFTFDDFPRTALHAGGNILGQFGLRGTYYASFGLMGKEAPTGMIFVPDDIKELLVQRHELGCHTFAHLNPWETTPRAFEDSIIKNKRALDELVPGAAFKSHSYPLVGPRPDTKQRAGRYFACCRGGGQTFNIGTVDLNYLKSFFIEHSISNPDFAKEIIDQNSRALGWLIFTTHDIDEIPTRYGCTPSFFKDIVKYSLASGARVLPVTEALDAICEDLSEKR